MAATQLNSSHEHRLLQEKLWTKTDYSQQFNHQIGLPYLTRRKRGLFIYLPQNTKIKKWQQFPEADVTSKQLYVSFRDVYILLFLIKENVWTNIANAFWAQDAQDGCGLA